MDLDSLCGCLPDNTRIIIYDTHTGNWIDSDTAFNMLDGEYSKRKVSEILNPRVGVLEVYIYE